MKLDRFDHFDLKTRCRAVFVVTLGLINPFATDTTLNESFFINLHEFARLKLEEDHDKYWPLFVVILPCNNFGLNHSFYESDETISNLYEILGEVTDLTRYGELLDSVGDPFIDIITRLATEYRQYLDSFNDYYHPTMLLS